MINKSGSQPNKLILWRGLHDLQLLHWIDRAWKNQCQLVIVPPTIRDFSFLKKWKGEIQYEGSWLEELKLNVTGQSERQAPPLRDFGEQRCSVPWCARRSS